MGFGAAPAGITMGTLKTSGGKPCQESIHRNLGGLYLGSFYLGTSTWDTFTWEPCGILHQGHLYFTWKLETFSCKPSPVNLPLGTLWEPVLEACQPLLWNLYICFWLRTLTWKPCGNQDCVTWEPCRNRSFWREPLLGQFVGTCIQGNLKNLERQTLSETIPCNIPLLTLPPFPTPLPPHSQIR